MPEIPLSVFGRKVKFEECINEQRFGACRSGGFRSTKLSACKNVNKNTKPSVTQSPRHCGKPLLSVVFHLLRLKKSSNKGTVKSIYPNSGVYIKPLLINVALVGLNELTFIPIFFATSAIK